MDLFDSISAAEQQAAADALKRHHDGVSERRLALANVADQRRYQAMLDSVKDWQPPELPQLDAFDSIILNFETNGVRWYDGDKMISAVIKTPDGVSRYLPIRHAMGPNIPEERFFEWLRREVRGKHIDNENIRFDLHMARADGVDLEAQGCTFGDPAHYAALLDDHRRQFNLDLLSKEVLGWNVETDSLGKLPPGIRSEGEFHKLPAGLVAPYGLRNVDQVDRLLAVFRPQIIEQELEQVLAIEQQIIPVVVEMEHNGAPIDVELLDEFIRDSQAEIKDALYQIKKATGLDFEKTNRSNAERLFAYLKIPFPLGPSDPRNPNSEQVVSFADALMADLKEPSIQNYRRAAQLESLNSKFLIKYRKSVQRDGILRYALHQLPYQEDKSDGGGGGGAVSGRFSSAALTSFLPDGRRTKEGGNIQQVMGVDTQKKKRPYTAKYLVKRLFKTATPGVPYVNADASQLQFRIFAHYADDPKIIQAYKHDENWREIEKLAAELMAKGISKKDLPPEARLIDFHDKVGDLVLEFAHQVLTRTHTKNVNFAQVFGAGVPKMSMQLGVPSDQIPSYAEWAEALRAGKSHEVGGPKFQEAVNLSETYHEMFPSVKPLLSLTSHLAMPSHRGSDQKCGRACRKFYTKGYEHRGWVRTYLGRRARFRTGDRFYSALNRIIQGTEADLIKRVLIEVHKRRHELGLVERFTVHDALAGDLHGDPAMLKEVLNTQYYPLKVPILWDVGIGANWAEAK